MPIPARVNLVTLGVNDLARSRAFYAALGWTEAAPADDSVAFFQLGAVVLGLFGLDALAADAHLDGPGTPGAMSLAINLPSRQLTDEAYRAALDAGATARKAPEEVFWGGYSGYFADPDGHLWEVAHNPFWELAPDGSVILGG
jgi:catechol 2,3-dioxygenase-like lactoylglutathione lyase family enzyme